MSKEVEGTISWPAPKGSIQARIRENVLATTEDGTVKEMSEGKGGFVLPDMFKNASGTQCYVWFEHHWNGMGDYRWDRYYVPSWAVITLPGQLETTPACPACNGSGKIAMPKPGGFSPEICRSCEGTGKKGTL